MATESVRASHSDRVWSDVVPVVRDWPHQVSATPVLGALTRKRGRTDVGVRGRRQDDTMRHIDSPMAAAELGHEILSVRQRPLVLISSASDSTYAFDPARVAHEIGDVADVVTIETGEVTYALERVLPEKAHVFGGAARSYPPDFGDAPDWWRSVLRFPERHDASELVDDALAQVTTMPEARELDRRSWVTATVELISGATGNVARLNSGTRVMVNADLLPPHIRLDRKSVV